MTDWPREWSELTQAVLHFDSSVARPTSHQIDTDSLEQSPGHHCAHCGKRFFSEKALAQHQRVVHGDRSFWRRFVGQNAQCPWCRTILSTRLRAIAHVADHRRNLACRRACAEGLVKPLTERTAQKLDAADSAARAEARRKGATQPRSAGWPKPARKPR